MYAKNRGRLEERLDVYGIGRILCGCIFDTASPGSGLRDSNHGFALHELFLIQKAAEMKNED